MQNKSYICNFIKEHENWKKIFNEKPYHINVKCEEPFAIFNYDTIKKSDFTLPEVQEARGIIINLDTLDVACWPFRKFGNIGEPYIDDIDWNTARVQEKIDGSIMKLWNFDGLWHVSSNSTITPYGTSILADYFWDAAEKQNLDLEKLDKNNTYIFELTGPDNQIILRYDETKIWHIGTRNNKTGQEMIADIGIEKPREYSICSLKGCIDASKTLNADGMEHEGFVVVDENWHRIKIKSPEYVMMAHMQSLKKSLSNFIELISAGEEDEYLSYFPDDKEEIENVKSAIIDLKDFITDEQNKMLKTYEDCGKDQKKFALLIQNEPYRSWGFNAVKGVGAEDIMKNMSPKRMAELIKKENLLKNIEEKEIFLEKDDEFTR